VNLREFRARHPFKPEEVALFHGHDVEVMSWPIDNGDDPATIMVRMVIDDPHSLTEVKVDELSKKGQNMHGFVVIELIPDREHANDDGTLKKVVGIRSLESEAHGLATRHAYSLREKLTKDGPFEPVVEIGINGDGRYEVLVYTGRVKPVSSDRPVSSVVVFEVVD